MRAVKVTVTSKLALTAYMLWIGVATASLVDYRANQHMAGVGALLMALIACTVHVRIGQTRNRERMTSDIGAMLRVDQLANRRKDLSR